MAGRGSIKGITVEIGGDTTKLGAALQSVNKEIKNTQSQLKDVEKLLKLDPGNTELLAQKERLLGEAVKETKEKLEAKKDYYERQGLLDQFYLEYFNEMNNEATRVLSSKLVQYGSAGNNVIAYALAVDPAISKKKSADQTAFALVSLHPGARYTIQRIDGYRGMTPQDTLATFFSLRKNLIATLPKDEDGSPTVPFACGVESVAYQEALNDLIVAEMAKSGDWFQLEKIKYTNEKKARILATLEPRYRNNLIFHSHKFLDYESQMDNFPRGHDDLLDAVCMAIDLLEPFLRESASIGLDSEDGMIYTDYDELVETGGI